MEIAEFDEAIRVLNYSLSHIKWRLKPQSKRRLDIDVLALCTGLRPVVMVDYGGKMPELQERLCTLLKLCQKESPIFEHLRVMIIEDMIYLIHVRELAEHVRLSLNSEVELVFVDLEQDPPKMIKQDEKSMLGMQFIAILKLFSLSFPLDRMNNDHLSCHRMDGVAEAETSASELITSQSSEFIDLSNCMQETLVTIPTLNGWLLGYPIVYLFSTEHICDAVYNLSTKPLRIYKILIRRYGTPKKESQEEELLSFSVPYDLSMGGSNEPWAETFLAHMQAKWEKCKKPWKSLQMEVSECRPQAIVL